MILLWAAAWAYPLSARQSRQLNSIQRKFLLNITGAYSTHYANSPLKVIEGIIPLHIKAKQEATYVRTARLRKASNYNNIKFNHSNYEDGTTSTKYHPAIFQLEDRISLNKQFLPVPGLNIYTDGSMIDNKTGCAFCVKEKTQRNTNGWLNVVPSTQSSKQSFLQYDRPVFGQARPTNRLMYGQTASRSSIQLTPRALLLNKHRKSY
ncbi:hypothetical protein AVEN_115298-1 [Araneus ventricosus]|uniref:RNase H type-1 domain-containing protein n=1 Tax=Araneus ventricosus TaxID=182803 RepID=A0A4Y1ZXZ2_ARAVE|nr:hypothetical protein AVEN_115298-1 [Araneus ventricosus]